MSAPDPVHVDHDRCVGSEECVRIAPAAFALDPDGLAEVLGGARTTDRSLLVQAARECPSAAIVVPRESGGQAHRHSR